MSPTAPPVTGRILQLWTPEDKAFWETQGKAISIGAIFDAVRQVDLIVL